MRLLALSMLILLPACGIQLDTYVAPSAEHRIHDVMEATELLNSATGEQTFNVYASSSEAAREDGVIIRRVESFPRPLQVGYCNPTRDGVVITITDRALPARIAHELGHAAGLKHHPDPDNFMHYRGSGTAITASQAKHMRDIAAH